MVTDRDRHEFYVTLHERQGSGPADTMMELLASVGWTDVARTADVDQVRADVKALRAETQERFEHFEAKFDGKLAKLEAKTDAQFARMVYVNVVAMVGVAGLVLVVVRLG